MKREETRSLLSRPLQPSVKRHLTNARKCNPGKLYTDTHTAQRMPRGVVFPHTRVVILIFLIALPFSTPSPDAWEVRQGVSCPKASRQLCPLQVSVLIRECVTGHCVRVCVRVWVGGSSALSHNAADGISGIRRYVRYAKPSCQQVPLRRVLI